jgi:hypothetical protein
VNTVNCTFQRKLLMFRLDHVGNCKYCIVTAWDRCFPSHLPIILSSIFIVGTWWWPLAADTCCLFEHYTNSVYCDGRCVASLHVSRGAVKNTLIFLVFLSFFTFTSVYYCLLCIIYVYFVVRECENATHHSATFTKVSLLIWRFFCVVFFFSFSPPLQSNLIILTLCCLTWV